MPPEAHELTGVIALAIKAALSPIQAKQAACDARIEMLTKAIDGNRDVLDRLKVLETKAAMPAPTAELVTPFDATPLQTQINALDAKLLEIAQLRERLVMIETKGAHPVPNPVDLTPLLERMAAADARLTMLGVLAESVTEIRDRMVVIEAKAAAPVALPAVVETKTVDLAPLTDRLTSCETRLNGVWDRLIVVETRAPMPGPAGKDGLAGKDGKDGVDGVGFDDLLVTQTDERTLAVKAVRGDRVKEIGTARFPVMIQRGVYLEGRSYEHGDVVTWAGSQWHCNEETTSKPGEGSKAWTLIVKRGRDGKDAEPVRPQGLPVVSAGVR